MALFGTAASAVFYGVLGGYALLATLVAASCLGAALGVLVRNATRRLIAELTFDVRPGFPD